MVWNNPQVTDNSGQIPTITCDADSGSHFRISETEVTCQAVDPTGNKATCSFTVKIEGNVNFFSFLGWYIMMLKQKTSIQNNLVFMLVEGEKHPLWYYALVLNPNLNLY